MNFRREPRTRRETRVRPSLFGHDPLAIRRRDVTTLECLEERTLLAAPNGPITATPAVIAPGVAGQPVGGVVATFVDAFALAVTGDFTARVNWGDGSPLTTGTITQPGGIGTQFVVSATHVYAQAQPTYPVTVVITAMNGATDTANGNVTIADTPIVISPAVIPPIQEGGSVNGRVASFFNNNSLSVASDFIATIDWGDGTQIQGTIVANAAVGVGGFDVLSGGPHSYGAAGTFDVNVLVISLGGSRNSTTTTVTVTDTPIVGMPLDPANPIATVAGTTFTGPIAKFTDFALAPVTDFTVSIDWGDGLPPSAGTVSANLDGSFTVSGSHLYRQFGAFVANVTVEDVNGAPTTFPIDVTASDPPLTGAGGDPTTNPAGVPVSAVAGLPFTATVASFGSPNAFALASQFVATIDWGDGTPSEPGTVAGQGTDLSVVGSHVYANPAPRYTITVTIQHTNAVGAVGSTANLTTTSRVLMPASGSMSRASDSGASDSDGITNIRTPIFSGRAEPGVIIQVLATAAGSTTSTIVGSTSVDPAGNWSVQVSPLGNGSFVFTAQMVDPLTSIAVQNASLPVTPAGGTVLVVDTAGPTVASLRFDPKAGTLIINFNPDLAGLDPSVLTQPSLYQFGPPAGRGVAPLPVRSVLVTAPAGATGMTQVVVTLTNATRLRPGIYVVQLNAVGLSDRAGNILVEKTLVTFPQPSNSPNPNYIAQIDLSRNGTASAPRPFIPVPEQIAAGAFVNFVNRRKIVRVPKPGTIPTGPRAGVPLPKPPVPATQRKK